MKHTYTCLVLLSLLVSLSVFSDSTNRTELRCTSTYDSSLQLRMALLWDEAEVLFGVWGFSPFRAEGDYIYWITSVLKEDNPHVGAFLLNRKTGVLVMEVMKDDGNDLPQMTFICTKSF